MAIAAEIITRLKADVSEFNAQIQGAIGTSDKLEEKTGTLSKVGGAMFLALGAAAVGFGTEAVHAAEEYESAHVRLITAIKNVGESFKDQQGAVENIDTKMRQLGFTDSDTETSLSRLIPATHSTKDAIALMGTAADVAAGRHLDLLQVTQLLVRAETGHATVLSRLGVTMKDANGVTLTASQAIQQLADQYKGQASAQADTFAGKIKTVEANLDHFATTVGDAIIPVITDLAGALSDVADFFSHNTTAAIAFGVALSAIVLPPLLAFAGDKISGGIKLVGSAYESVGKAAGTAVDGIQAMANGLSTWIQSGDAAIDVAARSVRGFEAMRDGSADAADGVRVLTGEFSSAAVTGEAMTVAIGEQASMLDANGAALDLGQAQLFDFSAAETGAFITTEAENAALEAQVAELELLAFAAPLSAGALGAVAAVTVLAVGGIVALGYALGSLNDNTTQATKVGKEYQDLEDKGLTQNKSVIDQYIALKTRLDTITEARNNIINMPKTFEQIDPGVMTQLEVYQSALAGINDMETIQIEKQKGWEERARASQKAYDELTARQKELTAAVAAHKPAYEAALAAEKKQAQATKETALELGVVIPAYAEQSKAMQKAVTESTASLGQIGTQALLNADITSSALSGLVKNTQNFAKSMSSSIASFTDPFTHQFQDAAHISEQEMENFFVQSQQQASDWAGEIQGLINRGVDQGIIQQMAQAGPGSKPALDAFVQMVDQHGVDWVNSVARSGQEAGKAASDAYTFMASVAALKSAETSALMRADQDVITGHGTAKLEELANSSDQDLARMARDALTHFGVITAGVNGIPSDHPINIPINVINDWQLTSLAQQLGYLTTTDWVVSLSVQGNAALAATGAGVPGSGRSDRNAKYNIVPVPW